jgi:hypothetical protein
MVKWLAAASLGLVLCACGAKESADPQIFLPEVLSPEGTDLEARRAKYCNGLQVHLEGEKVLTPENFRAVFQCANYDDSLKELEPLLTSEQFPEFIKNMNLILGSSHTRSLRETLEDWLGADAEGRSRVDRLLPILHGIIKNSSFREGLPLLHAVLEAGNGVWDSLFPELARLVYDERFPDTWEDISLLHRDWSGDHTAASEEETDYARSAKGWARFLQSNLDGKTVSERGLELAHRLSRFELKGTNLKEYLRRLNNDGVFVRLFFETGARRGEKIDPKLNAYPDEEERRSGKELSPEERQALAYARLFRRGPKGEDAPIVQLAGLVHEMHREHPDFLPAMGRWVLMNGHRIKEGITEYALRTELVEGFSRLNLKNYLSDHAYDAGLDEEAPITPGRFTAFVEEALAAPAFEPWLASSVRAVSVNVLGARIGAELAQGSLSAEVAKIYRNRDLAKFGKEVFQGSPELSLSSAITRFSIRHRAEAKLAWRGGAQSVESILVDLWWEAAREALGENFVLDYGVRLLQTLVSQFTNDFAKKELSLSEWYFASPYGNPSTTESMAGYAVKELSLLDKYYANRDYLRGTLAAEIFPEESDRRAFRMLVDQVPNLWLYIKSGMSRSGNDLTRALNIGDQRLLLTYVDLLAASYETGLIREGARLIEAYHRFFPPKVEYRPVAYDPDGQYKDSLAKIALTRLGHALYEPAERGNPESSTMGRLLVPLRDLVSAKRRADTEKFLQTAAGEILNTPDEKLNKFFREYFADPEKGHDATLRRREARRGVAELLHDGKFPAVVKQLRQFFEEDAVSPALDFLARKIDDGSLAQALVFLRRILGLPG